jgi:hypothetical protein
MESLRSFPQMVKGNQINREKMSTQASTTTAQDSAHQTCRSGLFSCFWILPVLMGLFGTLSCSVEKKLTDEERKTALIFEIKAEKDKFNLKEPFFPVTLSFINSLNKDIRFNRAFNFKQTTSELLFYVTSPSGEVLKRATVYLRRPNLSKSDFVKIRGRSRYNTVESINRWVQIKEPGLYKVYVIYRNQDEGIDFGVSAWTGELISNSITFEVVKD